VTGPDVEPRGPGPAPVAVHHETEVPGQRPAAYGAPQPVDPGETEH
jgi:hypothetical protein